MPDDQEKQKTITPSPKFPDLPYFCSMHTPALYEIYLRHPSVQTDTRKLKQGDLFFALKGDNFNGNKFAEAAISAGAAYAVIDEQQYAIDGKTILVDNVLQALQDLAAHHRASFNIPFIGITGSNGKTTTKELIHAVLSSTHRTYTTEGNLNNHIGVPLTILKIARDAEFAVIEMGANHQGEIAGYCIYANPTHGLITNAGKAHLEGFGGIEGVRKGKGELFDHLRSRPGSYAFVNWDYEYLHEMSKGISGVIKYGSEDKPVDNLEGVHVAGHLLKNDPLLEVEFTMGFAEKVIRTQLVGEYNLPNVLAAVTIGKFFGIPEDRIRASIEGYQPSNSRSQLKVIGTNRVILDAYNANPSSMKLAIENFAKIPGDKILLLGSMAEMGEHSLAEHESIIQLIGQYEWADVVLVGKEFALAGHPWHQFETSTDAATWMKARNPQQAQILVKGSRSMQMEKVLD